MLGFPLCTVSPCLPGMAGVSGLSPSQEKELPWRGTYDWNISQSQLLGLALPGNMSSRKCHELLGVLQHSEELGHGERAVVLCPPFFSVNLIIPRSSPAEGICLMLICHGHEVLSNEPTQGASTPYKFHPGCVCPYS